MTGRGRSSSGEIAALQEDGVRIGRVIVTIGIRAEAQVALEGEDDSAGGTAPGAGGAPETSISRVVQLLPPSDNLLIYRFSRPLAPSRCVYPAQDRMDQSRGDRRLPRRPAPASAWICVLPAAVTAIAVLPSL